MLKQSQKRTKRAAFTEASMSRQPARCAGWLATTPTGRPSRRAKPTMMFRACSGWISKKLAVVDHPPHQLAHVVGLGRVGAG